MEGGRVGWGYRKRRRKKGPGIMGAIRGKEGQQKGEKVKRG